MWVVYAVCSVLAPTTGITVSPRCYTSLMHLDQKKAKGLNFCSFVLHRKSKWEEHFQCLYAIYDGKFLNMYMQIHPCFLLHLCTHYSSCSSVQKNKDHFKTNFLSFFSSQIKYIDSLEFSELVICPDGPRVSAWSNEMVAKVIDADKTADGSFGKLQVCTRSFSTQKKKVFS